MNIGENEHLKLNEASRTDLVNKSRNYGKARFARRLGYHIPNFRGIDLEQLFDHDYLLYKAPIDDYIVTIGFPGPLSYLRRFCKLKGSDMKSVNLQTVISALSKAIDDTNDLKVDCSCPDMQYRFAYWATRHGYKYGTPQTIPSEKTNPDDSLGATCKHLDLVLSNKRWIRATAAAVNLFIHAFPEKASLYLFDEIPDDIDEVSDVQEEPIEEPITDQINDQEEIPESEEQEDLITEEPEESDETQNEPDIQRGSDLNG